ncbi:MAG: 3'(2'),5'-bisphosphate nucleotidase CysQ [Ignavibacteria bacterium]|nr:3'(2'),5'-bisphosphate nucleotidase CysQ [Ignavibacteria bacterium]
MLNNLLNIAIKSSYLAGEEIIKVRNNITQGVKLKKDKSYVTNADLIANSIIIEQLEQTRIPIVAEESIPNVLKENNIIRRNSRRIWLVDPLDGTSEFIKGGIEFTVNIALIEDYEVILGVVYVPVTKELYFAHKDIGSYKWIGDYEENLIEKSQKLPYTKTEKYTVVASKLNLDKNTQLYINNITIGKDFTYKNSSSSLKFCMVAEGTADIYPRMTSIKEWDTAAAHAIVKFAGKNVYTLGGLELRYNKEKLINPPFVVK